MTGPPAPVARSCASGTKGHQSWSAGELWALLAAIAADSFLRGHHSPSERKDWQAILVLFNDVRAFVDPSVAGTSRAPDHLKCQWRHMGSKGGHAERERTIAAFKGKLADRFNTREEPRRADVIDLAKSVAKEKADAVRREAAAFAMRKAEARRERRKLQVRARRAARAAGKGAIATYNLPSKNAAFMPPSLPRGPAPARHAATLLPPPPSPVPAKFWPGRLPPVEEVSFRSSGLWSERGNFFFFFFFDHGTISTKRVR